MKKTKNAVIAMLAAATMTVSALGLAACQKKDNGDPDTPPEAPETFTVTFKVNQGAWNAAGTETADKVLTTGEDGKLAAFPTDPMRDNYKFDGWYANASGTGSKYTVSNVFASDVTLYAKWSQESQVVPPTPTDTTYTITFNANGGSVSPTSGVTGTDGRLANIPTPTYEGHTFVAWYTQLTGGDVVSTMTKFETNTTIYAHWTENTTDPDPGQPNPPVTATKKLLINGAASSATVLEGTNQPDNVVYNYYAENVTLAVGDKVKFDIDGVTLTTLWAEKNTAIQGVTKDDGDNIDGDTVTIAVAGTYTVSITHYADQPDGKANIYVGYLGFTLGGDTTDPEQPDPPVTQKTASYKVGASGTTVLIGAPDTLSQQDKDDGIEIQYSITNTQFSANDKLYFTVGDEAVSFKVDGASTGVAISNSTAYLEITKAGKFSIYLKYKNSQWEVYAARTVDPSEVTKHATTVTANNAYLVGAIDGSDATWQNCNDKGFALTKQTDSDLYELVIELTEGDNVKFYKTGAMTSDKTWVGLVVTENIASFMTSGNDSDNIVVNATGKFHFLVNFARKRVYVSYSASGEPAAPDVPEEEDMCFLRGIYNGTTDWDNGWKMDSVALTDGAVEKYQIEVTVDAGKSLVFKVVYDGSKWIDAMHGSSPVNPSKDGGNLKLTEGKYIITLLVWDVSTEDWKIYIEEA